MAPKVLLDYDGPVAVITNNYPEKHNAFDDAMDGELFDALAEIRGRRDVRAVVWRGEGKSFSSGRDVASIGTLQTEMTHHEMMVRGHRGIQQIFELDAPIVVAFKGWAMGGSFQRALLCDVRVAAEGTRFRLPELTYGVIPDTGGMVRLFQICGPGVASDLVLTSRIMDAQEALGHGIVSRVVPLEELDDTAMEMARAIAAAPPTTVKMARRIIQRLGDAQVRESMELEMIGQTFINRSEDFAEFKASRAEQREPRYTGS